MVLYKYMKSLGNYVYILYGNTHVRSKVYQEFWHAIVYISKYYFDSKRKTYLKSLPTVWLVR